MRYFILLSALILAACGPTKKNYDASAKCQQMGHTAGTEEFEQCVRDEESTAMLEQQRREFERMKQDEQDWKNRRY